MKNVISNTSVAELVFRINSLSPNANNLWGSMNVNEMICHVSDQIRMSLGVIHTKYIGSFMKSTILKYLVLIGMPIPKGKVETVKELSQKLNGTKPKDFLEDRKTLLSLLRGFDTSFREGGSIVHPAFGKMNKNQLGRLIYLHLDHHLKQFGA